LSYSEYFRRAQCLRSGLQSQLQLTAGKKMGILCSSFDDKLVMELAALLSAVTITDPGYGLADLKAIATVLAEQGGCDAVLISPKDVAALVLALAQVCV